MPYIFLALGLLALATGFAVWHGGRGTKGEFSYLLVLGTKVDGESPGKMLRDRINAAYAYLAAHPDVTAIVSGYRSGTGRISEAECMRRELIKLGIAQERIWVEDQASSTKENLQFAMKLIEKRVGERPGCWACCPASIICAGQAFWRNGRTSKRCAFPPKPQSFRC